MRRRIALILTLVAAALLLFGYTVRQMSLAPLALVANDEVQQMLRASQEDQKRLSKTDPARADQYRRRFEVIGKMIGRLEILRHARERVAKRVELALIFFVALLSMGAAVLYLGESRRRELRMRGVQLFLEALSRGDGTIETGDRRRDEIGRINSMIEETSRVIAGARRRVEYLEHLSAWQEAARRHAHEIRTPLTAAQLELDRLVALVEKRHPESSADVRAAEASVLEELEQLRKFTASFVSFATIGHPQLKEQNVATMLRDFATNFAPMWPHLRIEVAEAIGDCRVAFDREMVRQVLVNLCSNSALAAGESGGRVLMSPRRESGRILVEVADDGPGIPKELHGRMFEPYTTTRSIGEGMGLGLSISKKIMLDHGGDLQWLPSERGARFLLVFPTEGAL